MRDNNHLWDFESSCYISYIIQKAQHKPGLSFYNQWLCTGKIDQAPDQFHRFVNA